MKKNGKEKKDTTKELPKSGIFSPVHLVLEGKTRIQTQEGLCSAWGRVGVSVSICRGLGIIILKFSASILPSKLLQLKEQPG